MVTEQQRLQLLRILSLTTVDMDQVVNKVKELYGIDVTPEQINAAIEQLKKVRGS